MGYLKIFLGFKKKFFSKTFYEFYNKKKPHVLSRNEPKSIAFVSDQILKIHHWKMTQWSIEYKNQKKTHQKPKNIQ